MSDRVIVLDYPKVCGARPLHGDGSDWCNRPVRHRGLHEGTVGPFRLVKPGSSPRSPRLARGRWLMGLR